MKTRGKFKNSGSKMKLVMRHGKSTLVKNKFENK